VTILPGSAGCRGDHGGVVIGLAVLWSYGDCSPELRPRTVAPIVDGLHAPGRKRASDSVKEVHEYHRKRNRLEREIRGFGAHRISKRLPAATVRLRAQIRAAWWPGERGKGMGW
jgi:hypothetical protein